MLYMVRFLLLKLDVTIHFHCFENNLIFYKCSPLVFHQGKKEVIKK